MGLILVDYDLINDIMLFDDTKTNRCTAKLVSTAPTYAAAGTAIAGSPAQRIYWSVDYTNPNTGYPDWRWWKCFSEMPLYFPNMPACTVRGIEITAGTGPRTLCGAFPSAITVTAGQCVKVEPAGLVCDFYTGTSLYGDWVTDTYPYAWISPDYWSRLAKTLNGKDNSYTYTGELYCGLATARPTDEDTAAAEPSGGSYARQLADHGAMGYANMTYQTALSFTNMPACTIYGIQLFDAVTGGNFVAYLEFYAGTRTISAGSTVYLPSMPVMYDEAWGT